MCASGIVIFPKSNQFSVRTNKTNLNNGGVLSHSFYIGLRNLDRKILMSRLTPRVLNTKNLQRFTL
ncbi:hypothetical protein Desdi_1377 [Desulfitobacterium dichloroeliminans LMG P-21439]|uniref:Uncharacterized protein n=1 Tax=Desulfitobacterium dichloroeliminans (strain LMG P-21439 / DCA1) TaxID=871963 RepID=L0F6R1_DESDL|nr:hypothetical protein Desdi_1377 [Desulfitobacterium dichloroeliminans LMG P-21439]